MHALKLRVLFFIFFFPAINIYGFSDIFNKNISVEELEKLKNGETLVKKLKSVKKISLDTENVGGKKAVAVVKKLKPSYLAEIIKIYPYSGNEDFLERLKKSLMDIESYVGIPYYSERAEKWYDLYSSASIKSVINSGRKSQVFADLEMSPFGIINTRIDTITGDDYFYYESTNLNKLRYRDKFNCVNKEKMKSILTIFRSGDYWVLYGLGAVDAPDIFFIKKRAEVSFMNRINTFCVFFFKKLQ